MTDKAQCLHCEGVISRPATRWVHADGRRKCGPQSLRTAEPKAQAPRVSERTREYFLLLNTPAATK